MEFTLLAVAACLLAALATALASHDVANRLVGVACDGLADVSNEAEAIVNDATRALERRAADVATSRDDVFNWGIYAAEKTSA